MNWDPTPVQFGLPSKVEEVEGLAERQQPTLEQGSCQPGVDTCSRNVRSSSLSNLESSALMGHGGNTRGAVDVSKGAGPAEGIIPRFSNSIAETGAGMAIVVVDGIEIDTANRIDANIAKVKDQNEPLGTQRKLLSKEIAMRKSDLQKFDAHDTQGRAHLKAYIQELERLDKELTDEWQRKVKEVTGNPG